MDSRRLTKRPKNYYPDYMTEYEEPPKKRAKKLKKTKESTAVKSSSTSDPRHMSAFNSVNSHHDQEGSPTEVEKKMEEGPVEKPSETSPSRQNPPANSTSDTIHLDHNHAMPSIEIETKMQESREENHPGTSPSPYGPFATSAFTTMGHHSHNQGLLSNGLERKAPRELSTDSSHTLRVSSTSPQPLTEGSKPPLSLQATDGVHALHNDTIPALLSPFSTSAERERSEDTPGSDDKMSITSEDTPSRELPDHINLLEENKRLKVVTQHWKNEAQTATAERDKLVRSAELANVEKERLMRTMRLQYSTISIIETAVETRCGQLQSRQSSVSGSLSQISDQLEQLSVYAGRTTQIVGELIEDMEREMGPNLTPEHAQDLQKVYEDAQPPQRLAEAIEEKVSLSVLSEERPEKKCINF